MFCFAFKKPVGIQLLEFICFLGPIDFRSGIENMGKIRNLSRYRKRWRDVLILFLFAFCYRATKTAARKNFINKNVFV